MRKQHLLRTVDFLVDELKVCASRPEAEQRVFFVSAKEVLQARINEYKGLPINSTAHFSHFEHLLHVNHHFNYFQPE